VSSDYPEEGENIVVIGSPFGLEHTISTGIVSSLRDIENYGKIIQITAPISPGSSGGPIINSRGKVVGIATFQLIGGQNLNFAIPGEKINALQLLPLAIKNLAFWTSELRIKEVTSADELLGRGNWLLLMRRNKDAANTYFTKALEIDPYYSEVYVSLSNYCRRCSLYADAEQYIKKAISLRPYEGGYYSDLARLQEQMGNDEDAIRNYLMNIKLDPQSDMAYKSLAELYYRLGRYNDAINAMSKSISIMESMFSHSGVNVYSHVILAGMYFEANKKEKAIQECKITIRRVIDEANEERRQKLYPYVYISPQKIGTYYWFEIDTLLYSSSVVTHYNIYNSYLSHVYKWMGLLEICDFLRSRDSSEYQSLYSEIYPAKQVASDTLSVEKKEQ